MSYILILLSLILVLGSVAACGGSDEEEASEVEEAVVQEVQEEVLQAAEDVEHAVEEVFDEDPEPILSGSNLQLSEDDNVLVQGVEGSPYAIGYFGYAYFQENQDKLQALAIEGVEPTADSAEDGSYPLARPLFIYSTSSIIQEKPQVGDFINCYLTTVNDEIIEVGYFPASGAALDEARAGLLGALSASN